MVLPFQLYGNWLVQMVVLVVSLNTLFTVSIKLTIESQPTSTSESIPDMFQRR